MATFFENDPTLQSYWRSIILYGRNVASYKFALGKALIDLNKKQNDLIKLEDLADPFSNHLCQHLKHNEKQIEKVVWTDNKEGDSILICETATDNDEGRLVANTINNLLSENNFSDFAILYRTNAQSRALEESLRKMGIPYKIYGGLSFYQRKEIKDVLAYFRMAINLKDEEALKRTINYPARGIGSTTIQKLIIASNENDISI